jgi:WD40 repeat protein
MKRIFTLLIVFSAAANLPAQNVSQDLKRTWHWYFGNSYRPNGCAGLDFSSGSPVVVYDGIGPLGDEGSASLSDTAGNLLLYGNNLVLYNSAFDTMQNGDGLMGDIAYSSTQGLLLLPQPNTEHVVFAFSVSRYDSLRYNRVDMNFDAGYGAVADIKNKALFGWSSEKLCAVRHCNGKDIWILSHGVENSLFYAYLLTDTGLVTVPVISNVGDAHFSGINSGQGAMKFSPDGKKVCVVTGLQNLVQLFDFDHETGVVSNPLTLPGEQGDYFYGCSFSPDNSKLYLCSLNGLIAQYDLSNPDSIAIVNSSYEWENPFLGALGIMSIGCDYRIYIARGGAPYVDSLAVINYPNLSGILCEYDHGSIYLGGPPDGGINISGLANFDESYFNQSKNPFPCMKVGMEEVDFLDDYVTVAPNPAHESATVQTASDLIFQFEISITDQQGNIWAKKKLHGTQTQLHTTDLPSGLYLITFQNPEQFFTKKLIIHH